MGVLEEARGRLLQLCRERAVEVGRRVVVRPLSPDEAIGREAADDSAIKKGYERVIEATFEAERGQAFTDHPSEWSGTLQEMFALGGLAQIPLTATNAVIATSALISQYWPDRRVTARQLSFNMGVMDLILPFFGGMPLCHGAGGLAGQYYFGARTGGTNIIEGLIEIAIGVFLAGSIASIFAAFPLAIAGAMMVLVGIEMVKFARDLRFNRHLAPVAATLAGSLLVNIAVGFAAGMVTHYLLLGKEHRHADALQ